MRDSLKQYTYLQDQKTTCPQQDAACLQPMNARPAACFTNGTFRVDRQILGGEGSPI